MDSTTPSTKTHPVVDLDVLGQQGLLCSLYTQITLCYALPPSYPTAGLSDNENAIVEKLQGGLEVLARSFPWTAGHGVRELSTVAGGQMVARIKPYRYAPEVVVKNHRGSDSVPPFEAMREANFPSCMVDESVVAPRTTLPTGAEEEKTFPVFILQVNFVYGGVLVTVNGLHSCMDMVGQGQLMYLLHKACTQQEFTDEDLKGGNMDRTNIFPLIENYTPGPELAHQIAQRSADVTPTPEGTAPAAVEKHVCEWVYYSFPPDALAELKKQATKTLPSGGFVSTDDTLSAYVWKSVSRVRSRRLLEDKEAAKGGLKTTFSRAVDARRFLGLPATYAGLVQNMTYHTFPVSAISSLPLGVIASDLRTAILQSEKSENKNTPADLGFRTRALATAISDAPEQKKHLIGVTATLDAGKDIMFSSWAKEKCYEFDFGLGLGKPVCVRRPRFVPVESLMYLMPKRGDGEIAIAMCLRREDLDGLRKDEEWGRYAVYVG